MDLRVCVAAVASLVTVLPACRTTPAGAVDPELAACIPAEARILAGVHLDEVRANPALQNLVGDWMGLLEPARDATFVLAAYTGAGVLVAARGEFRAAPPGATLLGAHVAVAGPAALVREAAAQHAGGRSGAAALIAQAEPIARQPVWVVASGSAQVPLAGNLANLNRLLALTEYATLAVDGNSGIGVHAAGICASADRARNFEETLRGLMSLASAATRDRDLAAALGAAQVRREDLTVRADVAVAPEVIEHLIRGARR